MGKPKIEVYKDRRKEWRFAIKSSNGKIVATGEGYKNKGGCFNGIKSLKNCMRTAKIVER